MKILITGLLASIATVAVAHPAMAESCTSLAQVARDDGYHYEYIGSQDAVTLAKGSLTILVRPGSPLYDVGDRSVSVDGPIPESRNSDVCVSPQLVNRFRVLSREYAALTPIKALRPKPAYMSVDQNAPMAAPEEITGLVVAQSFGKQAVEVSGKGTPNTYVNLTMTAMLSEYVPRVTILRKNAMTNNDGYFTTSMSVASATYDGAIIEVNATPAFSEMGFKSTRATIVMKKVLDKSVIPADDFKS